MEHAGGRNNARRAAAAGGVTTGPAGVATGPAHAWMRAMLHLAPPPVIIAAMPTRGLRSPQIALVALVMGTFFTAQTILMSLAGRGVISVEWDVVQELLYWVVWAALAPTLAATLRRWPVAGRPSARQVALHAAVGLPLALVQTFAAFGLHLAVLLVAGAVPASAWSVWFVRRGPSLVWGTFMGLFFVALIVGLDAALRVHQQYLGERLNAAELAGRGATLEAALSQARLEALRGQLRPHFLFNTLNAISVLTAEDADKARQMLLRLASLLRRSLDEDAHEVPLRRELAFLEEYLAGGGRGGGPVGDGGARPGIPPPAAGRERDRACRGRTRGSDHRLAARGRGRRLPGHPGGGQRPGTGRRRQRPRRRRSSQYARAPAAPPRRRRRTGAARGWGRRDAGNVRRGATPVRDGPAMRVLVVDDEPLARRGLRKELDRIPGTVVVGECGSRDEAVAAIVAQQPDVVLLDIQLGRCTAFEVIELVGVDAMPLVIFVTAYDRHAVKAFEVHAVDYVLKPVDPERLRDALDRASRVRALERGPALADRLERLLTRQPAAVAPTDPSAAAVDRIVVPDGAKLSFIDVETIDWIEAHGNQVRLHVGGRTHTLRTTMARIHARVGEARFVRIRRSALVNARAIASLEPYGKGSFVVALRGGVKLVSSRYHLAALRRLVR
jgi:two-component system, LytTR family, response regulator